MPKSGDGLNEPSSSTAPSADPLHASSAPSVRWTRANAEEIFPAAITHLTWSLVGRAGERGWRLSFYDAGILPRSEIEVPDDPSRRAFSIFYGRPAFNFEYLEYYAFAAFSSSDTDAAGHQHEPVSARLRRWSKSAWSVALLPRRLHALRRETDSWWRDTVRRAPDLDLAGAVAGLEQARARYERGSELHVLNSIIPVAWAYARVDQLTRRSGLPDAAPTILGGFRSLEEVRLAQALWDVAHRGQPMGVFLADFGFHGPVESELSVPSWREDEKPVLELVDALGRVEPSQEPVVAEARRRDERAAAARAVWSGLPPRAKPRAAVVIRIGRRYVPLRQVGKAILVQVFDAARACARAAGRQLADLGSIESADDVFFLTIDDIADAARAAPPTKLADVVAWRKERRREYLAMDIPREFTGMPVPGSVRDVDSDAAGTAELDVLSGQGVSAGVVEGVARVVRGASETIEAGEILVCEFTDPGWTPLFMVAAGAVLDVGGSMSHGAIIARELGIPCVLGTARGTTAIRTGDRLRVDGGRGSVEILERASVPGGGA
jgi:phosphohistidine swiveling domain-containing protein